MKKIIVLFIICVLNWESKHAFAAEKDNKDNVVVKSVYQKDTNISPVSHKSTKAEIFQIVDEKYGVVCFSVVSYSQAIPSNLPQVAISCIHY